jgi:hypothetical protein
MAVDGDAVDLIDAERAGGKCGYRDRRRHDGIDCLKNLQERRAQAVAAIAGLDIVDAAIAGAFRDDVAVLAVGRCERAGIAVRHGRRLFGIGDRLQDPIQHVGCELDTIRNDAGAKRTQRLERRAERLAHIGRDRRVAEIRTASDSDPVELLGRCIKTARRHRQAGGIAQIMCRDYFQQQRCVGNRAGDRPGMRERCP